MWKSERVKLVGLLINFWDRSAVLSVTFIDRNVDNVGVYLQINSSSFQCFWSFIMYYQSPTCPIYSQIKIDLLSLV